MKISRTGCVSFRNFIGYFFTIFLQCENKVQCSLNKFQVFMPKCEVVLNVIGSLLRFAWHIMYTHSQI